MFNSPDPNPPELPRPYVYGLGDFRVPEKTQSYPFRGFSGKQTETRPRKPHPIFEEKNMLTVTAPAAGNFELPPAGPTAARCTRLIDLGTQESTYQGGTKRQRKLLITWSLAETRSDGTPHLISRRFGVSLHEKAALRQFLQAWRGRPFTDEELAGFDLRKLLGAPCMLNLIHTARDGKDYCNIASVSPLPKGLPAPDLTMPLVCFDIDDQTTHPALSDLSENLQATIEASPEWKAHASAGGHAAPAGVAADLEDDIPF